MCQPRPFIAIIMIEHTCSALLLLLPLDVGNVEVANRNYSFKASQLKAWGSPT
jgi:hypothetical protein